MAAAWVVANNDKWKSNLAATQSQHNLVKFQCYEAAVAVPTSFISIYLLFESTIPMEVFYTLMVIAVFGRRVVDWTWEKQLRPLSLS